VGGQADTSYSYDLAGHLLTASNPGADLAFRWDSAGNQLSESLELNGPAFAGLGTKKLTRSYDPGNLPVKLTYPDGLGELDRGYDPGDRLTSLALGGTTLWQASYDGSRLVSIARGNGLRTDLGYTADGEPESVVTGIPAADGTISDPLHRLDLSWTAAHLRRTKERRDTEALLYAFHYDGVGHLESATDPRWPAVRRDLPALAPALPNLPQPTAMTEDWRVNLTDELTKRDRIEGGRYEPASFDHNDLHQVTDRTGATPASYTWDVDGNLKTRTGGLYGDADFTHDWRDKLTSVQQGNTTTDIVLDPLGRMVGKVTHTPSGDLARAYLHDGDQVVLEYVQKAGGTTWQPERRHIWGRWIDDLAVEQVDTDGDGSLETTLYPITDLLGSVQLLTDDAGTIVERITYDPDGTPHFESADTNRPTVTRVAWTGDGTLPTGDTVTPQAFEIGFSEPIDPASAANATATLTPDGGNPASLTLTLAADNRTAYLTGATVQAGTQYTLHLEGLTDTSHNPLWPEDATVTVTDPNTYGVLADTTPPKLLAVLDGSDALYLLFDEPVEPAGGFDMSTAVTITRAGQPVEGAATRVTSQLLEWQPAAGVGGLVPGGSYTISGVHLADLAGNAAIAGATFTHLTASADLLLLAYAAPTDTQPEAQSAYGLTTLFQGRTWDGDLAMYFYRARWYLPEAGVFAERDPLGYRYSANVYDSFHASPPNLGDPWGANVVPTPAAPRPLVPERNGSTKPETPDVPVQPFTTPDISTTPRPPEMRAGRGNPSPTASAEEEDALEWLRNRLTAGVSLDAWATLNSKGKIIHPVKSGIGVHAGLNLQLWPRPNGTFLVGLFGYDNFSAVKKSLELTGLPGPAGPFGVIGVGGSFGLGWNIAYYRGTRTGGFFGYSDDLIIRDWLGNFEAAAGTILDVGVSGFKSREYIGIGGAFPWASVGGGYSVSITNYYPISQATRRFGEVLGFFADELARIPTHNPTGESAKVRLIEECRELLMKYSERLSGR